MDDVEDLFTFLLQEFSVRLPRGDVKETCFCSVNEYFLANSKTR